jgi:hypothetical protein
MNLVYPHCDFIPRAVRIGGMGKSELIEGLERKGVRLNEAARILFAHPGFTTDATVTSLSTIEITVANLGCLQGAVYSELCDRADALGLSPCPMELGPHLRLQLPDGEEIDAGDALSRHRAPPGSVTVVSRGIVPEEGIPRGFYLRRIQGVPWLRGYWSGPDHVWSPEDRLLFVADSGGARARISG